MKTFFKTVFATMLGCTFSFILLIVLILIFVFGSAIFSSSDQKVTLTEKTILHITLDHPVMERSTKNPLKELDFMSMKANKPLGLNEIIAAINAAAEDPKISAIFIEPAAFNIGFASLEEIRTALLSFKKSGKPIIAYGEIFTQKSYYLASVADKIYLNPQGIFDFRGMAAELYFLKGTLDMLDVDAQIIRHGKYKSAVEPFTLDKMSDANREQYLAFLNSEWQYYLETLSAARNIEIPLLQAYADSLSVRNPQDALNLNFVDGLVYKDSVLNVLKTASGQTVNIDALESISLYKYAKSVASQSKKFHDNKIAVIYAVGEIGGGEGDDETIGSEKISRTIRIARLDENVKAIVIRVNSPGGSALASEVIWREVQLASQAKPVVVSMGDVAASGGYYIACAATKIVAQPNTITGSIGVFGVIFNMGDFFKNKLGVTFDVVKTNEYADMPTVTRPLTDFERSVVQQSVEEIYDTFLQRVADGRNMTAAQVDSIAQGRIWSGTDAVRLGLVDQTGGLLDAIELAAQLAGLDEYQIMELPIQKEFLEELLNDMMGNKLSTWIAQRFIKAYPFLRSLEPVRNQDPFMTRLPYDIVIL